MRQPLFLWPDSADRLGRLGDAIGIHGKCTGSKEKMYAVFLLAALALIVVIIVNMRSQRKSIGESPRMQSPPGGTPGKSWNYPLAFISRGKLFYRAPGQELREIHSPYVQGVMDRMERSRQLHGWKEGTAFAMSFTGRGQQAQGDAVKIQATSAQFATQDRMLYFLKDDSFGGLFEYDLAQNTEKRLVHKQNLVLEDLRLSRDGSRLLCAQHAKNGTANIAMMNADGSQYRELTGGDTVDTAPAWVPDKPNLVVYQSSGLARAPTGFVVAQGPASIQMANTAEGSLTAVLEDPRLDYLQPRIGADGLLYFIRRPYEAVRYGAKSALLDTLMFPFRLLRALFHFLNFFSLMYTRKPLTSAAGPEVQADLKDILLKGKRFDAEAALRSGAKLSGVPSLVPASWQLVCRNQQGVEKVLASHVASFDIAADGTILFTNGYGAFALDGSNPPLVLLQDKLIGDVIVGSSGVVGAGGSASEAAAVE